MSSRPVSAWSYFVLAGCGWMFTYLNDQRKDQRAAQLERVNDQLRQLYGPLLSCVSASRTAFDAMVAEYSIDGTGDTMRALYVNEPDSAWAEAYRLWAEEVFRPLNERAAELVIQHADLLESDGSGGSINPALLQLVAHVASRRVALKWWKSGQLEKRNPISFPDEIHSQVETVFLKLKARQAVLLGHTRALL